MVPLTSLSGQVQGPDKAALGNILIRLAGDPAAGRYTTTDQEGWFAFYNLREGDYEVVLDPATLPPDAVLEGEARVGRQVRIGTDPTSVLFRMTIQHKTKPVRRIELQ